MTSSDQTDTPAPPKVLYLGERPFQETWQQMRDFTDQRTPESRDQIWLLQHPPIFTLGQAGKPEHVLNPGDIPVVNTDRGGQVTYHGPGQLVGYLLLDLRRWKLGVRQLVTLIEESIVELLADYGIESSPRADAPGVYTNGRKIAALGLRVRRGCSYHGLSLNVDMDPEPFSRINPCGYPNMQVAQIADFTDADSVETTGLKLTKIICRRLSHQTS